MAYDPFRPVSHLRTHAQLNFIVMGAGFNGNAHANALYQSTPEARVVFLRQPAKDHGMVAATSRPIPTFAMIRL